MKEFPKIADRDRLQMLEPISGKVEIVLDTDAYNEVDDQFAIAYAFLSPEKINVKAVYACPFFNTRSDSAKDGMEKSYREIFNILRFLKIDGKGIVFKGSDNFITNTKKAIVSSAANDLIKRSEEYSKDKPLYVVAIGALTNIASALLMDPSIIDKIVVVWLGGHAHSMPDTREFNMKGDVLAAQIVLDSGAVLIQLPCRGVVSNLYTTIDEMKDKLWGKSVLGTYLSDIVIEFIKERKMDSKVIWDVSAIAWLINPSWIKTSLVPCPIIEDDLTYSFNENRHIIRVADSVKREEIFSDLFEKIAIA